MGRMILTADQLQKELRHRVAAIREVWEDRASVDVPLPAHCGSEDDGCNWDIPELPDAGIYEYSVRAEIRRAREIFNLPD